MAGVTRKTFLKTVDGTPKKRFFLSIISDYGLKTGLCELVDNALDHWVASGSKAKLTVDITLDPDRQLIQVFDNAGGVSAENADLLISPGASGNDLGQALIGIFGVGGKRAGVALGELVEIRTRHASEKSIQVDLTKEWVNNPDWDLDIHEIPDIAPGTTTVDISKVRQSFDAVDVGDIQQHLGETYAWFVDQGCQIRLNGVAVAAGSFANWVFPPDYLPKHVAFQIEPASGQFLNVDITGGLIVDRDPEGDNYGVYFICNNRLIVKELKVRDVGYFVPSEAGVPHPDASLSRVIVKFSGPAELMPWTSSKSGINYTHPAFLAVRRRIIDFSSYYTQVSRRLKSDWDDGVLKHTTGTVQELDPVEAESSKKKILPKPPSTRQPTRYEQAVSSNRKMMDENPWVVGLVEAMGLVDIVSGQKKFQTRNRAALILLDSNFEIALKEFITHNKTLFPVSKFGPVELAKLFMNRTNVITAVQAHVTLPTTLLKKINHYYDLRNNLIHQRATVAVTDAEVSDYRGVIEKVLKKLFSLKFPADA
jgi:hypothetical protein